MYFLENEISCKLRPGTKEQNCLSHNDVVKWNIFRVTDPLCGELPLTKASDTELWCFLWSAPERTIEQAIETPVIRDAITLIMTSL